ncbi:MAG: ABC transporter ATP-binding protein [Phycisphaerales bacterium JB038]
MNATPRPAIRFEDVGRRFTTAARGEMWALRHIDLAPAPGELTCVLGPSGCGKTTLLRLAAGLDRPSEGRVAINGRPVAGPPEGISLVTQEGSLLPWRRVINNVTLGLEVRGVARAERLTRARRTLRRVHLPPEVEQSYPHELSGGMRQRVALARALCPEPDTLLMDEPFAGVDEPTRHRLQAELLQAWDPRRQSILFVTHNPEEAVSLADRIVVMAFARVVADIRVELPRPRDPLTQPFIDVLLELRRLLARHWQSTADAAP